MNTPGSTRRIIRPDSSGTPASQAAREPRRGVRRALARVGLRGDPVRKTAALAALVGACLAVLAFVACTPQVSAELRATAGVNAIRVEAGLPPLTPDYQLVAIARARSADMAAKGYFGHNPPDGCNYVCLMDRNGVRYAYAAENIAWNDWPWDQTADVAVRMWHNSPPHLANILNCHFTRFGTGVARAADGKIYYTMVFEGDRAC
ncbi:MAG: CAP domain-containing protein [Chloroflexota bacterium]|nr:CAP domain-containing protein [Chloroflexota bacterium]